MADVEYRIQATLLLKDRMSKAMAKTVAKTVAADKALTKFGTNVQGVGRTIAGNTGMWAKGFSKVAAVVATLGSALLVTGAVRGGMAFNKVLEDSKLQAATMFQMFDFGAKSARVVSGEMSQWQHNLEQSKAAMSELYDIAKVSPASFQQAALVYQNAAAGLATQTEDLSKHMLFMEKAVLLGGITRGDYQVLGAQMGRILAGSAGAEMDLWKVLQKPLMRAGKETGIFTKEFAKLEDMTQAFNVLSGDNRLKLMMAAMGKVGPEVAKAWQESMGGMMSTARSAVDMITKSFTSPLYDSFKKFLLKITGKGGIFDEKNLARLELIAGMMGGFLARGAEGLFNAFERGVNYLMDNWQSVANTVYHAFQMGSLLIKALLTKWAVGALVSGAGKVIAGAGRARPAARAVGALANRMGAGRRRVGMLRQASMGMGMAKLVSGPLTGLNRAFVLTATKIVAFTMTLAPLALALGIVGVIVGGIAVYIISKWDEIAASIASMDSSVFKELAKAGLVLWKTFELLGAEIFGTSGATGTFIGIINLMTGALNIASSIAGGLIWVMGGMIGIWGGLQGAMLAFSDAAMVLIGVLAKAGIVSQASFEADKARVAELRASTEATVAAAERYIEIGEKAMGADLKDLGISQDEIDAMAQKVKDAVTGGFEKTAKDKPTKGRGSTTNIHHLTINQDLRDQDPDRIMASFIDDLTELTNKRTQPYGLVEQGV